MSLNAELGISKQVNLWACQTYLAVLRAEGDEEEGMTLWDLLTEPACLDVMEIAEEMECTPLTSEQAQILELLNKWDGNSGFAGFQGFLEQLRNLA